MTLVVVNARVATGNPRRPWADAVVVRGDQLALVGGSAEARKLAAGAPDARVVDARGATLVPGVADSAGRGTLEPGGPADFTLLDRAPTRPSRETRGEAGDEARVLMAVAGGRVVAEPAAR